MKRLYKCHCFAVNFTCSCWTQVCEHLEWLSTVKGNTFKHEMVYLAIASWHRKGLENVWKKSPSPNHIFTHAFLIFLFYRVMLDLNRKVHPTPFTSVSLTASYKLSEIRVCQLEIKQACLSHAIYNL